MVYWSQPLGSFLLSRFTAGLIFLFILNILEFTREGVTNLFFVILSLVVVSIVYHLLIKWRLGELYDHEMSHWFMKRDEVLRRLDAAMRERGVQVAIQRDGNRATIPLPPLSIVVAPGWVRTKIFVGPSTDKTELLVWRLKAWIEVALRTG